jgi:hypothetical protein
MNADLSASQAAAERTFISLIERQTSSFRQNLLLASSQGYERTPQGLTQILSYVAGVSVFLSTYEPLAQLFEAQGLHTLSERVSVLRNEIAGALMKYQPLLIEMPQIPTAIGQPPIGQPPVAQPALAPVTPLAPVPPIANNPPEPLSTPEQFAAFYAHLQELAQINAQAQAATNHARDLMTPHNN